VFPLSSVSKIAYESEAAKGILAGRCSALFNESIVSTGSFVIAVLSFVII
jgi:hypothetical protein